MIYLRIRSSSWNVFRHSFHNSTLSSRGKMATTTKVTSLFAHGGGFCKETWNPVIRRLKELQMFQTVPTDFVTFNFPYHGDKHESAAMQSFQVDLSNPEAPRVWNKKHDLIAWLIDGVQEQVGLWKKKVKAEDPEGKIQHKLIGIGHSMGSSGLWATEVANPGTFDGLILFEPIYSYDEATGEPVTNFLVATTLQRDVSWSSRAAAEEYFYNLKNFAKWDREALHEYVCGCLVDAEDGTVTLACHPIIEASLYCQKHLWLTEHQLQQPKCRTTFHWGSRSKLWFRDHFQSLQKKLPHIYTLKEPMEGNSHLLVFEDPATATENIVKDLAELEPYNALKSNKTDCIPVYDVCHSR